jgi:hypothetical protein
MNVTRMSAAQLVDSLIDKTAELTELRHDKDVTSVAARNAQDICTAERDQCRAEILRRLGAKKAE